MAGSFQEQSASFEHMYSPSRAKSLFSKHGGLKDRLNRDVRRMRWEWKTCDTELSKSMQMFQKRSDFLQKKVKDIEDRYFAAIDNDDDDDDFCSSRPSTGMSSLRCRSAVSFRSKRPQTSCLIQTPTLVNVTKRPKSETSLVRSRHNSNNSRPTSASDKLLERKQQPTVHFELSLHETEPAPIQENTFDISGSITNRSDRRSSSLRFRHGRAMSALPLTKAKRFELRNQQFYEENERHKTVLKDRIEEYYDKVKQYKEVFDEQKEIDEKNPVQETDDTKTKDNTEESKKETKYQIKLRNPYGMTSNYQREQNLKSIEIAKAAEENKVTENETIEPLSNIDESQNVIIPLTKQNLVKLNLAKAESISNRGDQSELSGPTRHTQQRELLMRKKLSGLNGDEEKRERARLLYQEAHSDLQADHVIKRNISIGEKPINKDNTKPKPSELRLDKNRLKSTFSDFLDTDQNIDQMRKMLAEVAKLKAKTKKARDRSILPFMSAHKAARTWKELVAHSKAANAQLVKEQVQ